jgi:diguanylate cyclase (GGDEF)-like protein
MRLYLHTAGEVPFSGSFEHLPASMPGHNTLVFECNGQPSLLQTLDLIAEEIPSSVLNESYAMLLENCDSVCPEDALSHVLPFNTLYARLRHAWLLGDLEPHVEMHFQPIVDFAQNGAIFGYEVLCRMKDPSGKILNGEEAFRLARQVNRAAELDLVCQKLAFLGKARSIPPGVPVFINVLPRTLLQEGWLPPVLEMLGQLGIDRRDVVIEIVESEEVSPDLLAEHCDRIRTHGLRIALDDMGSGFNGLRTLAAVRADFIKIDRAIVHEAQGSRVRTVLLEAIVSMAQRLGCTVVAEGLERIEDITFCQDMGLMYAQGYYFSHPQKTPVKCVNPLPVRDEAHRSAAQDDFRLIEFMTSGLTMELNLPVAEARRLFRKHADVAVAVVLDGQRPLGLLRRGRVFASRVNSLGSLCEPLPKLISSRASSSMISRSLYLERGEGEPWVVVSEDGNYLGVLQPLEITAQLISRRSGVGGSVHPLSQLTTGPSLRQSLDTSLRNNPSTQLVYIDLDHFKAYNDRYGFIRGDAMIRLLAEILRLLFHGQSGLLLGHIGGDDFVLILDRQKPGLIQALLDCISRFQSLAAHLYDSSDLERGFFTTEDGEDHPVASISIAVVNGKQGRLTNSVAAAERAAMLKKIGKATTGSIIVVEGDPPQQVKPARDCNSDWEGRAIFALQSLTDIRRNADPHVLDSCFIDFPFFEVVFELDAEGRQVYPNWINPNMYGKIKAGGAGVDRSSQPYYTHVRDEGVPYLSNIYLSSATEDFCLTLSIPLMEGGKLQGVLVADINIAAMAMLSNAYGLVES